RTPVSAYSLKVEPGEHFINWQQDPFGNYLARFVFPKPATRLSIDVSLIADMTVINPFDFFLEETAEQFPFEYDPQLRRDLMPYLEVTDHGPLLKAWLSEVDRSPSQVVNFLVSLNQRLQGNIAYLVRMEPGVQSCEQTLSLASGSCRDSAWLLVQILRHLGLAARFVSGYLVQLKADQAALDGPSGAVEDFTDLHAWAEVFLPGGGWIGLDPTSGLLTGEGHIPLACTPDPVSAAAITGATGPAEVEFSFSNTVERVHEDPRVTKPYDAQQWQQILKLGDKVEKQLVKGDVRLTMGGEPTFVSIDDMDGPEWNYTALSETKRDLAGKLMLRLREKFAPEALLHVGQGKWYPGEPLPRWALSIFWRSDGKAVVRYPDAVVDETTSDGYDHKHALKLAQALARDLGLSEKRLVPGYEDVSHYLMQENRLPINVDPTDPKLDDPLERARIARLFVAGIGSVAGYALPLKWQDTGNKEADGYWKSSAWPFRNDHMLLIPGDSPMGFRLPLASLPWEMEDERDIEPPRDTFEPREALPVVDGDEEPVSSVTEETDSAKEIVHTALCVQSREGRIYVFVPPQERLEVYLDLANRVANAAKRLKLKIVLEGYQPPRDPRLNILQITPDPGVIEVNIHPASNWRDLVDNNELLYEEARQTRLGTEKFMLDGRHSGTGGGNHVTMGAAQPADSPFLRRPDLLRSFITYWQRHPSLSYLFSGMFIGPTSQAPRADEARDDNLYELEIALDLLPEGDTEQLWLVDRLLRNSLVDLTGNTHRAEFCIDKLYSPDGPTGRKGLVEFRAFEMPPHAHMSIVQLLLLRAMVARFWRKPYRKPLIRWGTELHDRFMLRHFVWEDLCDVLADMRKDGYAFDEAWFAPFLEFRFPLVGSIEVKGMQLDVHNALEPWHVLGEESTTQGTARYVDSSIERLQVSIRGMKGDRYTVACNGRPMPLRPTGERGSFVAGLRYKAWDQHSSLHPTIKVHSPLVFDVVDTANARSIAGATYYVAHPGGRNYDTFPLNANEAEARRGARFFAHGASQDRLRLKPEIPHPDQPFTLDLRTAPRRL
ncbi:MAG: transglutaminase family protein, partial [Proteobacteria bacterium]|nr:transglutaminase family protein [Pseudomonadota bacterium]